MIGRIRSAIILGNSTYLEPGDEEWIQMANLCREYHSLPRSGGYLDQDPVEMEVLAAIEAAYAEKRKIDADKRS
jgi:hypothetical protein